MRLDVHLNVVTVHKFTVTFPVAVLNNFTNYTFEINWKHNKHIKNIICIIYFALYISFLDELSNSKSHN